VALIPEYNDNGTTSDNDKAHAQRLYQIVKDKKLLTTNSIRPSTWARHFTMLRANEKVTDDQIGAALDWYSVNAGRQYVPEIYCGKTFRGKFDKLKRAMEKARKRGEGVEISKDAERVIHNVKGLGWRAGRAKLPAAVQVTTDNRNEFVRRLTTWAEFYDKTVKTSTDRRAKADADRRLGVLRLMLSRAGPTAVDFGVRWFHRVHDTIANWDEWSGEFSGFVFDTANDYTAKWGQKVCQQYSGRSGDWDSIVMEALR
jgi:hypothetical protein